MNLHSMRKPCNRWYLQSEILL